MRAPLALALGLALLSSGCAHHRLLDEQGEPRPAALRRLEDRTARARGLSFERSVRAEALSGEEVKAYFEARYAGPSPALDVDTKVAHKLGVLPGHVHLKDLYSDSYARNAAAVYEPAGEGRMLLFPDAFPGALLLPLELVNHLTATDWLNELIVSHELVHALQDQHFDLKQVLPGSLYAENEDAALARKAVVESEANLVSYAVLFGMDPGSFVQRNLLAEYLLGTSTMTLGLSLLMNRGSPSFYTKVLTLQYFHGMRFLVASANRGGGLDAITAAYQGGLPESTEQLLWPEKLTPEAYDPPKALPPLDDGALPGWTRLASNTFGELSLRTLLEGHTGRTEALEAARGWGGDRYDVLERDARVLLAWRFSLDRPKDAAELAAAYERALHGKYGRRLVARRHDDDGWRLWRVSPSVNEAGEHARPGVPTRTEELVALRHEGDRLLVLEGLDPATWREDAEEVWERTRAHEPPAEERPRLIGDPIPPALLRPRPLEEERGLERALFLDHHEMELRLGLVAETSHRGLDGAPVTLLFRESHARWGFRPHLELALPLVLSVRSHETPFGRSIVAAGLMSPLEGEGDLGLSATHALTFGGFLGVAGQARVSTFGAELVPSKVYTRVGGALLYRPCAWLFAQVGAAWDRRADVTGGAPEDRLVLGAALSRGLATQPLVELRLVDGLHLYETSRVVLRATDLALLEHSHALGLLLYF